MNVTVYLISAHGCLGLLEKKKDYKLRANDFNNKKQVLKHLRKKALNKNPDEFYFHMANSKTVDGGMHRDLLSKKTKDKSETANTTDQIRLVCPECVVELQRKELTGCRHFQMYKL